MAVDPVASGRLSCVIGSGFFGYFLVASRNSRSLHPECAALRMCALLCCASASIRPPELAVRLVLDEWIRFGQPSDFHPDRSSVWSVGNLAALADAVAVARVGRMHSIGIGGGVVLRLLAMESTDAAAGQLGQSRYLARHC